MVQVQIESTSGAQAKIDFARAATPGALAGSFYQPRRLTVGRSEPVISDSRYNSAPGIYKNSSGRVGIVYSAKTGPSTSDGDIKHKYKDNVGTGSWGTAATIATAPGGSIGGYQDCATAITSDSVIRVTASTYNSGTSVFTGCWLINSTNNGVSWSSPVAVPASFTLSKAVSAPLVDLGEGTWILPIYGRNTTQTFNSIRVLRTTNFGATWTEISIANGETDTLDYLVPYATKVGNSIVMMFQAGVAAHKRTVSLDGGLTWTTPTTVLSGTSGRPSLLSPVNGTLLLTYRSSTTGAVVVRASRDLGVTWTPEQLAVQGGGVAASRFSQAVEIATGEYGVAASVEKSGGAAAEIRFFYITDVGYTTKNADGEASHRDISAVLNSKSIVAYDDLDRADESPLGFTPSGQPWLAIANGGHKIVNGNIYQSGATSAVSISVLQTYKVDGSITAPLTFPTAAGMGLVFRLLDTNNYLYAAIDTAAGNISLSKVVAGTTTQIGVNTTTLPAAVATHPFKVSFRGNRVRVIYDDEKVIDYTLTSPEMTIFGAATQHGIRTFLTDQFVGPVSVGA